MASSYTVLDQASSDNGKTVTIDGNFSSITSSLVLVCVTVGVLAAISFRFVPALIGFMSGDGPAQHTKAKENLWAGIFGLAVILLLIPFATSINSTIGKLTFTNKGSTSGTQTGVGTGGGNPVNPIPVTPVSRVTGSQSETTIRNALSGTRPAISINKNPCTDAQMRETNPSCTNLQGLPQEMVNVLLGLRSACPACGITVTGGTEPGHSTHGIGRPAFDLNLSEGDALYNYITTNATSRSGPSGRFNATYILLGSQFNDERAVGSQPRHWHVNR